MIAFIGIMEDGHSAVVRATRASGADETRLGKRTIASERLRNGLTMGS